MKKEVMKLAKHLITLKGKTDSINADLLNWIVDKTEAEILTETNQKEMPAGLKLHWVDLIAHRYQKFLAGSVEDVASEHQNPVRRISEGDKSIEFDTSQSHQTTISKNDPEQVIWKKILKYRRFAW